jgi:hypothetical protein
MCHSLFRIVQLFGVGLAKSLLEGHVQALEALPAVRPTLRTDAVLRCAIPTSSHALEQITLTSGTVKKDMFAREKGQC